MLAQEHFISCLIRKKIISAIDAIPHPPAHAKKMVFFLLEDEHHEVGLLLASFIAAERGFKGRSTYEKDKIALYAGADPDNKFQETIGTLNEKLFKYNLMTPLTNFGERFAFNSGLFDAYSLAAKHGKQRKLSNAVIKQMNQFDLNKQD